MAKHSTIDEHSATTSDAVNFTANKSKGFFSKLRRHKDEESTGSGHGSSSGRENESPPAIEIKVPSHRMKRNDQKNDIKPTSHPSRGRSVKSAPTIVQKPTEKDANPRCHLPVVEKPKPRSRAPVKENHARPRLAITPEPPSLQKQNSSPAIVQKPGENEINPRCQIPDVEKPRPRFRSRANENPRLASVPELPLPKQQKTHRIDDNRKISNDNSQTYTGRDSNSSSRRPSTGSNSPQAFLDHNTFRRHLARGAQAPVGDVTVVFTDLQGSTTLWEKNPTAMKAAVDLHDKIIRRCYGAHSGYEITTEGDAFQLAFQHPIDALAFALKTQVELHKADWSPEILALDDASEKDGFRGFRVRMGLHHGRTKSRVHVVTKRTFYVGEAVDIAKAMEGICYGGQILTTVETWRAVSGISEQVLGSPQVMDCGEHELDVRHSHDKGPLSKRVVQLVPNELAFDYFAARGREEHPGSKHVRLKKESDVVGRKFAPLKSKNQICASFFDAPYANGKVTIIFIYTKGIDDLPTEIRKNNRQVLAKVVRSLLAQCNPHGYECQEENGSWMLAFGKMAKAVSFGLRLVESTARAPLEGDIDRSKIFKIGVHTGPFTSMGPHTVTGRADYFGPVVNRAARVASQSELGQVIIGMPLRSGEIACPPDFGNKITTNMVGIRKLKGLTIDMALFSCSHAS
mmetsp:Transcript_26635/g.39591  ORF Transcript_26635/g.39591 Transcript_26635/m.39591 type:complete len:686 (-) Transcript_26635:736-2793(-)